MNVGLSPPAEGAEVHASPPVHLVQPDATPWRCSADCPERPVADTRTLRDFRHRQHLDPLDVGVVGFRVIAERLDAGEVLQAAAEGESSSGLSIRK